MQDQKTDKCQLFQLFAHNVETTFWRYKCILIHRWCGWRDMIRSIPFTVLRVSSSFLNVVSLNITWMLLLFYCHVSEYWQRMQFRGSEGGAKSQHTSVRVMYCGAETSLECSHCLESYRLESTGHQLNLQELNIQQWLC